MIIAQYTVWTNTVNQILNSCISIAQPLRESVQLRGVCGMTMWDGESNERVCERCGMGWSEVWSGRVGEEEHSKMVWTC